MFTSNRRRHRRSSTRLTMSFGSILLLAQLGLASQAFADLPRIRFDGELAYTTDDNVARAQLDRDIEEDSITSIAIGATTHFVISQSTRMLLRGVVRHEAFNEFKGLTNTTGTITATLLYRADGTFLAPTWGLFARAGLAEYDSDLRDNTLYSVGASVRKPITDRITGVAILQWNLRDSDSTVFDTHEGSLLGNLDYALSSRWTLFLTYNYLDGEITSTGQPWLKTINIAERINGDDAFGGAAANRFAYRIEGKTHVATLGANFRITERHSLDFSVRSAKATADLDDTVEYERTIFSAAYLTRF